MARALSDDFRVRVLKASTDGLSVVAGNVGALPFLDASFDGTLAVHVLYFRPDLVRPFAEIARVLGPGRRLVLLFRTSGDPRTASFPNSVYSFRSVDEVGTPLEQAGFTVERVAGSLQGARMTSSVVSCRLRI